MINPIEKMKAVEGDECQFCECSFTEGDSILWEYDTESIYCSQTCLDQDKI